MKFIKYQKHWLATVKLLTNSGPRVETSNEVISAPLHSQNTLLLVVCIYVHLMYILWTQSFTTLRWKEKSNLFFFIMYYYLKTFFLQSLFIFMESFDFEAHPLQIL